MAKKRGGFEPDKYLEKASDKLQQFATLSIDAPLAKFDAAFYELGDLWSRGRGEFEAWLMFDTTLDGSTVELLLDRLGTLFSLLSSLYGQMADREQYIKSFMPVNGGPLTAAPAEHIRNAMMSLMHRFFMLRREADTLLPVVQNLRRHSYVLSDRQQRLVDFVTDVAATHAYLFAEPVLKYGSKSTLQKDLSLLRKLGFLRQTKDGYIARQGEV